MPTEIGEDEMIDEAIGELIDDGTAGFHLTVTKEPEGIVSVHDDRREPLEVGDETFQSPLIKMYHHVEEYMQRVDAENDETITFKDILATLLTVHENVVLSDQTSVYEVKDE